MIRRTNLLTLVGIALMGALLFRVKYEVIDLESRQKEVKKRVVENNEALDVLRAEWAHLNDPSRLQILCKKYLAHLVPLRGVQMVSLDQVMANNKGYDKVALEELIRQVARESAVQKDKD